MRYPGHAELTIVQEASCAGSIKHMHQKLSGTAQMAGWVHSRRPLEHSTPATSSPLLLARSAKSMRTPAGSSQNLHTPPPRLPIRLVISVDGRYVRSPLGTSSQLLVYDINIAKRAPELGRGPLMSNRTKTTQAHHIRLIDDQRCINGWLFAKPNETINQLQGRNTAWIPGEVAKLYFVWLLYANEHVLPPCTHK